MASIWARQPLRMRQVTASRSTRARPWQQHRPPGSADLLAATGEATLAIVRGGATVRAAGGTFDYDGAAHVATAIATGVNGEDLGALTFTYNGGTASPRHAGTYQVVAFVRRQRQLRALASDDDDRHCTGGALCCRGQQFEDLRSAE